MRTRADLTSVKHTNLRNPTELLTSRFSPEKFGVTFCPSHRTVSFTASQARAPAADQKSSAAPPDRPASDRRKPGPVSTRGERESPYRGQGAVQLGPALHFVRDSSRGCVTYRRPTSQGLLGVRRRTVARLSRVVMTYSLLRYVLQKNMTKKN